MVIFKEERFLECFDEAVPLLRQHWEEIARNKDRVPLAPNVPGYIQADEAGRLCIVTARHEGALVGYAVDFVIEPPHYSATVFAESDIFWIAPAWRGRSVGLRLLLAREKALQDRRVLIVHTRAKLEHPQAGRLLSHLGHAPIETVFSKVL